MDTFSSPIVAEPEDNTAQIKQYFGMTKNRNMDGIQYDILTFDERLFCGLAVSEKEQESWITVGVNYNQDFISELFFVLLLLNFTINEYCYFNDLLLFLFSLPLPY